MITDEQLQLAIASNAKLQALRWFSLQSGILMQFGTATHSLQEFTNCESDECRQNFGACGCWVLMGHRCFSIS